MYSLYVRHGYLDKSRPFIKNVNIREYDIKDCGFTILQKEKMLSKKEINYIDSLIKLDQNIFIGELSRTRPELNDCINSNLILIRQEFQEVNNIDDDYILSIKRDAIFVKEKLASQTKIQGVTFVEKNIYDCFLYLNEIEFYLQTSKSIIETKGLGKNIENDFLTDLKYLISYANNKKLCISKIKQYSRKYIKKQLPLGSYRELNNGNMFVVEKRNLVFYINNYDSVDDLCINYNYMNYIIPLFKVIIQS